MRGRLEELGLQAQFDFSENDHDKYKGISKFSKVFWSEAESIEDLTSDLLSDYVVDKGIRYTSDKKKYYNILKIILCNCCMSHLASRKYITISLSKKYYSNQLERYAPILFSYDIFKNILDWLVDDKDYLNLYLAPNNPTSKQSSIMVANQKLIDLIRDFEIRFTDIKYHERAENIIFKEASLLKDYEETQETINRRDILQRYSTQLNAQIITIRDIPIIDQINAYCVYSNSLSEDGRIFGVPWFNRSEEDRSTIKINGKATIEIDIATCSIRIAQHLNGHDVPHIDMYLISGYKRDLIKDIANRMFNVTAVSPEQGCSKTASSLYRTYTNKGKVASPYTKEFIRVAVDKTYNYYRLSIDNWLFKGKGLELQHWDSKVCFKVIENFLNIDKVVLTVHDSFITIIEDKDLLRETIINSYREVIGYEPVLR